MERLTERFNNGQAAVLGCGNNCKYDYKYCHNAYEDCPTINEIYERLAAYEDTKLIPEKIAEIDKLYLEKCQEVNRLNAELAELRKQPQGDLISRSLLIKSLSKICGDMDLVLPDKIWDIITAQPIAYDVKKVVLQLIECAKFHYEMSEDEELIVNGDAIGHVQLAGCYNKAVNIVRNGGKE